jgi:hypothetical protein
MLVRFGAKNTVSLGSSAITLSKKTYFTDDHRVDFQWSALRYYEGTSRCVVVSAWHTLYSVCETPLFAEKIGSR